MILQTSVFWLAEEMGRLAGFWIALVRWAGGALEFIYNKYIENQRKAINRKEKWSHVLFILVCTLGILLNHISTLEGKEKWKDSHRYRYNCLVSGFAS